MSTKPLLKESLLLLNIFGINPANQSLLSKIKSAVTLLLLAYLLAELFLQFILNWNGWNSVDEFTVCAALMQMMCKISFLRLKSGGFSIILDNTELFQSWDDLPEKLRKDLGAICNFTMKTMKLFIGSCLVTVIAYAIKPFFLDGKILPYNTYHPIDRHSSPNYELMYIFQVVDSIVGVACIFGFDGLFFSLILHVVCDLKILKHRFSHLQIHSGKDLHLKQLHQLVDHHNLILGFVKKIDRLYSVFFLNQFAFSMFAVCTGLLSMVASGFPPDLLHLAKYSTFLSASLIQLLMYCVVGDYLLEETESVSSVVFQSDWWAKSQIRLRKGYALVIQRSQKGERLSAGGMLDLNSQSFTGILKFALSFFTMAQALYIRRESKSYTKL